MGVLDFSKLRIGDGVPSNYTRLNYSTSDIITSLTTFSEENFRGILSLEVIHNDSGIVSVSADGLAFFLKLLLCEIHGRAEVIATLRCERKAMYLRLDCGGVETDTARLSDVAMRSGFELRVLGDSVIEISTEVRRTNALTVYASSSEMLLHHLYEVFFMNK